MIRILTETIEIVPLCIRQQLKPPILIHVTIPLGILYAFRSSFILTPKTMKHFILITIISVPGSLCAQSLSDLYKKVSPSVVVIETEAKAGSTDGLVSYIGSQGSGVLISDQGEILTPAHVVNKRILP